MLEKGILNEGNPSRLMGVMERAARGEEITIAYLGGSITAGSSASPQDKKCYAALSTTWWNDTFPEAKINYVNAGIGATDSWKSVGNSDGTHPDNPGHALIARLLTEYYRRVLSGINETEDPGYTVPDLSESQTRCRYRNADLIFSDKGWKTTSAGSISFTVTTREIGIAWLQKSTDPDGICADYQLIIDGEPAMTLPGAASSWGPHPEYRSVLLEETASHKIELRPVEGSTGTDFEILALGIVR